ncbi:hypothetical protein [Oscillatoria sp. HE19RPO]|uniref:hypothetical protein n=1 Tax=Oscillatoria sp. HE19RPO TaxID=2954806 RepID=UPI0020C2A721|nr:hypothetical protein [Oscillatoria sp. HE19RPO]
MGVRKKWAGYSALMVLPWLGIQQALPATAQYPSLPEQPSVEMNRPMDLEAQPSQEDGETGIAQLTETERASLEDLELSIDFNKEDFVRGAAILPENNEAQSPNASDLAQARFPNYRYSAGFDLPNFGWVRMDGRGIDSVLGINVGLGVSYKKYFQPALPGQFTGSWGVGTFALVLPYATIGGDYQWDNGWYAGGNIGAGLYYFDDVTPFPVGYIGVGYRW